mmetsp:Transcript_37218/g.117269  ORF Transcript_37218/g.117269 Transcript_37218/m.117269 type:complete len:264 (+) Transcript_37218:1055-1846(+)
MSTGTNWVLPRRPRERYCCRHFAHSSFLSMRTPWFALMNLSTCSSLTGMSLSTSLRFWLQFTRAVVTKTPTPSSIVCARIAPTYSATRQLCQMSSSSPNMTQTDGQPSGRDPRVQRSLSVSSALARAARRCWNCVFRPIWWTASMLGLATLPTTLCTSSSNSSVEDQLRENTNSVSLVTISWLFTERRTSRKRFSRDLVPMCAAMSPMMTIGSLGLVFRQGVLGGGFARAGSGGGGNSSSSATYVTPSQASQCGPPSAQPAQQ